MSRALRTIAQHVWHLSSPFCVRRYRLPHTGGRSSFWRGELGSDLFFLAGFNRVNVAKAKFATVCSVFAGFGERDCMSGTKAHFTQATILFEAKNP